MRVVQLWRYPVKSMQGEQVEAAEVGPLGVDGDRRWAIFDPATGYGLTARRSPDLLFASARLRPGGDVEITLPDGTVAVPGAEADAALSDWLGTRVELRRSDDVGGGRQYENPADVETEAEESWAPFDGEEGAFHDSFTVTLLSAETVQGRPVRRFRPNVLLDEPGEDELVGDTVRIGEVTVRLSGAVPRCVMVTRPQPGGIDKELDVLRWIHRERDGLLAVGGGVVAPGRIRVGDEVRRVG